MTTTLPHGRPIVETPEGPTGEPFGPFVPITPAVETTDPAEREHLIEGTTGIGGAAPSVPPTPGRAQPTGPFIPAAPRRSERAERLFLPLLLIGLGLVFLVGNVLTIGGGASLLGLGLIFLLARILRGNYGLAAPAGILLGLGGFVSLIESDRLPVRPDTPEAGGWFFLMLALGFVVVYVIGARPAMLWPFFPAAAMAAIGLLLLGTTRLDAFAPYLWLGAYWPLTLVAVGLWLLVRGYLPEWVRTPLALVGVLALLLYGLVILAAGLANADITSGDLRTLGARTPYTETVTLTQPIGPNDTFRVGNVSGRTEIRPGPTGQVRVEATKHLWAGDQALDVHLVPAGSVVTLDATRDPARSFGNAPYVDYVVEVPAGVRIEANAVSGAIEIRGVDGPVQAVTTSGGIVLADLGGPATARSTSGALRIEDVRGELRAQTISGVIRSTGADSPREFATTSGRIDVTGRFAGPATVRSISGGVTIRFAAGSAARIEATTMSGDLRVTDLALADQREERHGLSGTVGAGGATVQVSTTSGDVTLTAAR